MSSRSLALVLALGIFLIGGGHAPAVEAAATSAGNHPLKVLIIGHSLAHGLKILEPLAPLVGHPGHEQMLYTILGAGISWHYHAHPDQWRKQYFGPGQKWDALIMSARNDDDAEFAPKFAAEALKGNPQCQVFIYGNWPSVADDLDRPAFVYTDEHIDRVGAAVDKAFPRAPKTRMMPSMRLMRELWHMADRGELPGVSSHYALFVDAIHPSRLSTYALNMMAMAMLYNESPLDYPSDIYAMNRLGQRDPGGMHLQIPAETATAIKRVVWDVLQTYPPAGMKPTLVIADRRLEPVIAGQPCKVEFKALHAAGPCAWSIVKGTLPQGMTFSGAGLLAGQSAAVGDYPVTVQLSDGKGVTARPLVVSVNRDTPPVIPDQPLETVALDQYVMRPLKVEGGVGHITWSTSGGTLPHGLMLSPAGVLVGSPGEAGDFTFTVKAQDAFPAGPRGAEKTFTWRIGPAGPETLLVKSVVMTRKPDDKTVVIDGKLDESFWKLDQPIAKKVLGKPGKQASFGLVWMHTPDWKRNGQLVHGVGTQVVLGVKVLDGPRGKTAKDGIHIFIDGNHNRSVIYSGDDSHFLVPRKHTWNGWIETRRGRPNWFTQAQVHEIEGGYTVEIRLQNNYFVGDGNWLDFGDKGVYGFDVAVDEGDDKQLSQQVWRGDANDAEDTSHFGTIVLVDEPAAKEPSGR